MAENIKDKPDRLGLSSEGEGGEVTNRPEDCI